MEYDPQHPHHTSEAEPVSPEPDLLDEPALPPITLSAAALLAVFVGGTAGTICRYLLEANHPIATGGFPWVTLAVNLSGSLVIGFLLPLTDHLGPRALLLRPLVIIGFLGGWTTYSTLTLEATLLAKSGDVVTGVAYLATTVVGGLLLVVVGHALGRRVVPS